MLPARRYRYLGGVSAHLATCPNCSGEMDVTDVGPYTRVRCPECGEEVRVKTEMGPYHLVRRIAFGGMSVVFVARDLTLDREIAVKVLKEKFSANEKREEQFKSEARLTATVSHPNVVRVYKVGRAFERYFIAMELVPGQSLDERMSVHGALPEDAVIRLALQIVDGLRAARSAGLIHRDIKPGNILIDEAETAKLVDFGLSLLTEEGTVRSDEIWATPTYVAPEVLEHAEEDHRADIYALGATLYHALAGAPPVKLKEVTNQAACEAKKEIPSLKKMAPWLSNEIVQIVERAMMHDPARRFEDYEEFRADLEMVRMVLKAKGTKVPVHGAIRAKRRERHDAHRRVWLLGVWVVVFAALVAGGIYFFKVGRDDPEEEDSKGPHLVLDPEHNPTLDPEVAMQINETYEGARQALVDDDFVVAEEQFLRVWHNGQAPTETAAWAGFEAAVAAFLDGRSADARQHLADLYDFVGERQAAETVMGRRLQSAAELLTDLRFVPQERVPEVLDNPFRATVFFAMALKMWEQGELERAHAMFSKLSRNGPWPKAEWMSTYRQLARRYLKDYNLLGKADYGTEGKSRAELQAGIEALDELYASLLTRGRARFNVKVWQSGLKGRLRHLRTRKVQDDWRVLLEEVAGRHFANAQFPEGARALQKIELAGELERNQRAVLLFFCREAEIFIEELARTLGPGADGVVLNTRSGTHYTQIIGSQKGGLMVEKDGAALSLSWKEIGPGPLLALHRVLIDDPNIVENKGDRLLQAVAFAWLSDLKDEARGMAGELIELRSDFRERWDQILENFGG